MIENLKIEKRYGVWKWVWEDGEARLSVGELRAWKHGALLALDAAAKGCKKGKLNDIDTHSIITPKGLGFNEGLESMLNYITILRAQVEERGVEALGDKEEK